MKKLFIIGLVIIIVFTLASCSDSQSELAPDQELALEPEPDSEPELVIEVEPQPEPELGFLGISSVYSDLMIELEIINDFDYYKASDKEKRKLAEKAFDEALEHKNASDLDLEFLCVNVWAQDGNAVLIIEQPTSIATPRVTFSKKTDLGDEYNYEWYDKRYGDGIEWGQQVSSNNELARLRGDFIGPVSLELFDVRFGGGFLYACYIITGDYDYHNSSKSDNEALAEIAYDNALAFMEANHPGEKYISVMVFTQDVEDAFFIDNHNSTGTPLVYFSKITESGSEIDYEWYDTRYGDGEEWNKDN